MGFGSSSLPFASLSIVFVMQIEQFVPASWVVWTPLSLPVPDGRPVVGLRSMMLGNWYLPSYGAGAIWFSIDQPSKHLNCDWAVSACLLPTMLPLASYVVIGASVAGSKSSHILLPARVAKKPLVGSWPAQFMFGM